ncbi:SpoIIIAH-like family protein [Caldalkalibacillus thermarum TA2.A1]|uniref:SpoIIIAH-like family protein n=1 Tax=Caldalkalibacillus thermarum (strain TA2.A1) TaxID=986075 RepID=A0A8X8LAB1_CALTT|nr:SpoIIIAH-like family protein [Caldalkalibacillus thermarum]QZT32650.1 SpoIIIAH-like family protein [Caldalkalibacillus thermarum TA2.A1]
MMVLRKQTIWLLTMLTLMVVLSAYYLFNGSPEYDYVTLDELDKEAEGEEVSLDEIDWVDTISDMNGDFTLEEAGNPLDFFIAYRIERERQRADKFEEYQNMMNASEATAQTVAEAQAKIEAMWDQEETEYTLENLIKQEGYEDALVIHTKNEGINVIVRSDEELDKKEVLKIIHLVRKHLDVPGHMVTVDYR